jgi:hypothetical protein
MSNLDTHELAWAAGFFDGEGCISCSYVKPSYLQIRLHIAQIDKRVLDRFRKAVGRVGINIGGPYTRKKQSDGCIRSTYYQLGAHNSNVINIFNLLKPYLCETKVKQGEKAIAKYEAYQASLTNPQGSATLVAG